MRWAWLALLCGCAIATRPTLHEDALEAALVDDLRGESARTLAAWGAILERDGRDESVALLALNRIDAIVASGVAEQDAKRLLARIDARTLSPTARRYVPLVRAKRARLAGDDAEARALEKEAGCGAPWRASRSLGPLPHVDVARGLDEAALSRDLSPALSRGCRVVASTPDGRPGALPLAVGLIVAHAGTVTLELSSEQPFRVWIDTVATPIPDERAPIRTAHTYRIQAPAGRHRLVIVQGAPYGRAQLDLAVTAPPSVGLTTEPASRAGSGARIEEVLPSVSHPSTFVERYLAVEDADRDGDADRSRAAAQALLDSAPRSAVALDLAARVVGLDPTIPLRIARDRARRLLERAIAIDPSAARVRLELGRLAIERERTRDALEILDGAPDRTVLRVALLAAEVLRARGREAEVRAALDAVPTEAAGSCSLEEALLTDDRSRHRVVSLERAQRVARCRAGSTVLGDALRQRGDLVGAIAADRRAIAADPIGESARAALAETLAESGDARGAVEAYEGLVAIARRSATYCLKLVDALLAAGRAADARVALDRGLALDPESAELAAAARSFTRASGAPTDPTLALDRIDGRDAIRQFEAAHRRYDAPGVYVLDRNVTRVYTTGAQRTITHDIVRVLTKDGIDRWGEWQIPSGAELLTLCAWKKDGTRVEPEEVPEKESISLPNLSIGDYVEVEYIERAAPPAAFPTGFLAERFYFASADAPLDRSEYVIVTPRGMKVDLDRRGPAPTETTFSRDEPTGGVTVRTFAAKQIAQVALEPASAPTAEHAPSVRASSAVTRRAWRDYLIDLSWGTRRRDPALAEVAAKVTQGARTDDDVIARLVAWVYDTIRAGEGLSDAATSVLARREGSRATLLCALAEAKGLACRLLVARSLRAAQIETDLEGYDSAIVEIAGRMIDVRHRYDRVGELPPYLRGAEAIVLAEGPEVVTLPSVPDPDRRAMAVHVALHADGSGDVVVEEHLTGWPATQWREGLEKLAADRVKPQFEQHTLGYFFPGSSLTSLTWENATRFDVPFVVRYAFSAPGLARRRGDALVLTAPFAAKLEKRYATGEPRTMPVFIDEVAPTELELDVTLPKGTTARVSPPVQTEIAAGRFSQTTTLEGNVVHMRSRFDQPTTRVTLDEWPSFLQWIGSVDRAESDVASIVTRP